MITQEQVEKVLVEVVEADPDRQVTDCQYVDIDGRPDCVVGHALANLGLPLPSFWTNANRQRVTRLGRNTAFAVLTDGAIEVLSKAQSIQDTGTVDEDMDVDSDNPGRPWRDILTEMNLDSNSISG